MFRLITKINPHLFEYLGDRFQLSDHDSWWGEQELCKLCQRIISFVESRRFGCPANHRHVILNSQINDTNDFTQCHECYQKNKLKQLNCKYSVKSGLKSLELTNLDNFTPLLTWQLERTNNQSDYNIEKRETEVVLKMLIVCHWATNSAKP